jgi:hypothetical protein
MSPSLFVIAFLVIYMLLLIRDLDNPFSYYEAETAESVSLKPLKDFVERSEQGL